MTGRFVSMAFVLQTALLLAPQSADAQMPPGSDAWCPTCPPGAHGGQGMAAAYGHGHPWTGKQPVTRPYQPGPANWSYDNMGAKEGPFYGDSPLDEFLRDVAQDSYIRFEYLDWSFRKPGNVLLGSPLLVTNDPRITFPVTIANQLAGNATVASTGGVKLSDVPGGKMTLGVPFTFGTIESSIFSFENNSETTLIDELGQPIPFNIGDVPTFVATSTLSNGQVGNNLFLYDDFYQTRTTADLWGADVVLLMNSYLPKPAIQIRPLIGFRYIGYDEQLVQRGSFNQLGALQTPVISTISSDAENNSYIPQVGVRIELPSRWVTIGMEPRVGVAVNTYDNLVFVEALRSIGDPRITTADQGEKLALAGEFSVYGRIHLHPDITLHVGYTIMGVDQISRAASNLRYNDNGPNNPADVTVRSTFDLMYFQGLNVGGEIRF